MTFGTCPGTLILLMIKYLHKIIDGFSEVLRGTKAYLMGGNIFKVWDDEGRELLSEIWPSSSTTQSSSYWFSASK